MRLSLSVNGVRITTASLQRRGHLGAHLNLSDRPGEGQWRASVVVSGFDTTNDTETVSLKWSHRYLQVSDVVQLEVLGEGEGDPPTELRGDWGRGSLGGIGVAVRADPWCYFAAAAASVTSRWSSASASRARFSASAIPCRRPSSRASSRGSTVGSVLFTIRSSRACHAIRATRFFGQVVVAVIDAGDCCCSGRDMVRQPVDHLLRASRHRHARLQRSSQVVRVEVSQPGSLGQSRCCPLRPVEHVRFFGVFENTKSRDARWATSRRQHCAAIDLTLAAVYFAPCPGRLVVALIRKRPPR